jgi:hypothetical protein
LKFDKRRQLSIRVHNETLSVVAMCVCNPDRSPAGIHGCDAAPTPTGFAEIVSDGFPVLHARDVRQFTGNGQRITSTRAISNSGEFTISACPANLIDQFRLASAPSVDSEEFMLSFLSRRSSSIKAEIRRNRVSSNRS